MADTTPGPAELTQEQYDNPETMAWQQASAKDESWPLTPAELRDLFEVAGRYFAKANRYARVAEHATGRADASPDEVIGVLSRARTKRAIAEARCADLEEALGWIVHAYKVLDESGSIADWPALYAAIERAEQQSLNGQSLNALAATQPASEPRSDDITDEQFVAELRADGETELADGIEAALRSAAAEREEANHD